MNEDRGRVDIVSFMVRPRVSDRHLKGFAERLKALRLMEGYSQMQAFADLIEVDRNAYYKYERAESWPVPETLIVIAERTGVSIHWLLTGKGPRKILDEPEAKPADQDRLEA